MYLYSLSCKWLTKVDVDITIEEDNAINYLVQLIDGDIKNKTWFMS